MVLKQGLWLTVNGVTLGVGCALAFARVPWGHLLLRKCSIWWRERCIITKQVLGHVAILKK